MERRIIIENRSSVSDEDALDMVGSVIALGRISNEGKQYCYGTSFGNGCMVFTDLNKASDRFVIVDQK